jgi:hypothetical protein
MAGNSPSALPLRPKVRTASPERTNNHMGDLQVAAMAFGFCDGIFRERQSLIG